MVGLSLSCLVAIIEYAWSRRRLTRSNVSTYSSLPQYRTLVQYLSTGHQYSSSVVGLSLSCLVATIEYDWRRRRLTRTNVMDTSTVHQWWGSPSPA